MQTSGDVHGLFWSHWVAGFDVEAHTLYVPVVAVTALQTLYRSAPMHELGLSGEHVR